MQCSVSVSVQTQTRGVVGAPPHVLARAAITPASSSHPRHHHTRVITPALSSHLYYTEI